MAFENNASALEGGQDFTLLAPTLEKYAPVPGSLITILQRAQDIYGYLSPEAIDYISAATGIRTARIYGVATFYAQFRLEPIGKYLIMMCKGTACHVNGADRVQEAVSEYLGIGDGETTADGIFTLNNVACLGCCSLAPVMMIKSADGEETYGNLTKDSVVKILEEIRSAETQTDSPEQEAEIKCSDNKAETQTCCGKNGEVQA